MAGASKDGALRAATTCMGIQSQGDVFLRLALPALQGNEGEELGLCTPQFQDVPLWPAVWRKAGQTHELLVGAECVSALTGTGTFTSAQSLFESAVGVVAGEVLYVIQGSTALNGAGTACAYRLSLEGPARE